MPRRWDDDERGHGVADARMYVPGARELLAAMEDDDWVAEEPEAHLLPHVRHACEEPGSGFELLGADVEDDGVFVVRLHWHGNGRRRAVTEAVWKLLGTFAETASYVRGPSDSAGERELVYDLVTGMIGPDTAFAPHGHTVRLRIDTAG
ncbi:MAG TPA: hypothetical protein VH306_10350 [Gaiellaceae bacterium]